MKFYNNCDTLPIYNFEKIFNENNLLFLLVDYDGFDSEITLNTEEQIEAQKICKEIMYEYSFLTENTSIIENYIKQAQIEKEEFKYNVTNKTLELYLEVNNVEILLLLNSLGWDFDSEKDVNIELEKIVSGMKKLKTRINVLKNKYENKYKPDNTKKNNSNLEMEAILLAINLKLSYSIDTKKTSVSKWLNMIKVSAMINKPKT